MRNVLAFGPSVAAIEIAETDTESAGWLFNSYRKQWKQREQAHILDEGGWRIRAGILCFRWTPTSAIQATYSDHILATAGGITSF
jgi:hypothetical protein